MNNVIDPSSSNDLLPYPLPLPGITASLAFIIAYVAAPAAKPKAIDIPNVCALIPIIFATAFAVFKVAAKASLGNSFKVAIRPCFFIVAIIPEDTALDAKYIFLSFKKPVTTPNVIAIPPNIDSINPNSSLDPVRRPNILLTPVTIRFIGSKAKVNILSNAPTGPPTKSTNILFIFSTASVNFCCASRASNL